MSSLHPIVLGMADTHEHVTQTNAAAEPKILQEVPKEWLEKLIRQHVWGAMGVGLIPLPLVDLVGLAGIQINLVRKLAQAYHIPFAQDTAKNVISSLVGSALPVALAPAVLSFVKVIPLLGQTLGAVTMPLMNGAATYALGKVFGQHFATGGTFLTFDPEKVKAYYTEMLKEGQKVATEIGRAHV